MSFDDPTIKAVWGKGRIIGTNDPAVYRKDECNAWMYFSHYGNRDSQYGWEIDHIKPVDLGGSDKLSNLRPLQWENNASRGALERLVCSVTANEKVNGPA